MFNLILIAFPKLEDNLQPFKEQTSLIMTFADFVCFSIVVTTLCTDLLYLDNKD